MAVGNYPSCVHHWAASWLIRSTPWVLVARPMTRVIAAWQSERIQSWVIYARTVRPRNIKTQTDRETNPCRRTDRETERPKFELFEIISCDPAFVITDPIHDPLANFFLTEPSIEAIHPCIKGSALTKFCGTPAFNAGTLPLGRSVELYGRRSVDRSWWLPFSGWWLLTAQCFETVSTQYFMYAMNGALRNYKTVTFVYEDVKCVDLLSRAVVTGQCYCM
jgi:hypothetical protein